MNSRKIIIITILFVLFCTLLIFVLSYLNYVSSVIAYTGYIAILFTTINYSLGMLSIKIGFNKDFNIFMLSFYGGILVRIILLLILVFIALKFLDISRNIFIFLVLFFYILYLISEIIYLVLLDKEQKKING